MATYKERLHDDYETLRTQVKAGELSQPARNQAIDEAVSAYVLAQDEAMGIAFRDTAMLDKYANLVLHEDLTWSHPDKMSIVEYPVMSDSQEKRRERKFKPSENVYYDGRQVTGKVAGCDVDNGKKTSSPVFNTVHSEAHDDRIDVLVMLEHAGLTSKQREAVELAYFEGLTQEQAAERMGLARRTIRTYVDIALGKLKEIT